MIAAGQTFRRRAHRAMGVACLAVVIAVAVPFPRLPPTGAPLAVRKALAAADVTQWKYARRIDPGPVGWTEVVLDGLVLGAARPDLADVRILDADKVEIPWKEAPPAQDRVQKYTFHVFGAFSDPLKDQIGFLVDFGGPGRVTNTVVLGTTSRDFFKRLSFEASDDAISWEELQFGGGITVPYVYDLTWLGGGRCLEARFPPSSRRYLRVTISDLGTPPLESLSVEFWQVVSAENQEEPVPVDVLAQGWTGNDPWTIVDLRHTGIRAARLGVWMAAEYFRRPVIVEGSNDRVSWTPVARAMVYRTAQGGVETTVGLPSATFRFYRVTVVNGDEAAIAPLGISVSSVPRKVVFKRTGSEQLFLLYGNPRATRPAYDPTPFEAAEGLVLPQAGLGRQLSVMTEPEKVEPPESPTKSDADPKYWRFERVLGPWSRQEGFAQIDLDIKVFDGARPDLADLRLVDSAGCVVPFKIEFPAPASGHPPLLGFEILSRGGDDRVSWLVLDLHARYAPSQMVVIWFPDESFRKDVLLEGSNDGEQWTRVVKGTVQRIKTIFGLEENTVLVYPQARYRYLKLTFDEPKSDPQMKLEVRGSPPGILFMAREGEEYHLFYGNPDAQAQSYPPALFVDAYNPTRLSSSYLGPEIDHQPPPERPPFLKPGEGDVPAQPASQWVRYGLWALLAAVVLVTGFYLVRVFRAVLAHERTGKDRQP